MGARIDGSPSALILFHEAAKALGLVFMYSGNIASIPAGYHLCDGAAGTKDLRNRFIVAADADDAGVAKTTIEGVAEQTGGATSYDSDNEYTNVTDSGHDHALSNVAYLGSGTEIADVAPAGSLGSYLTGATDTGYANITDSGHHHGITSCPPFYALAFMQAI